MFTREPLSRDTITWMLQALRARRNILQGIYGFLCFLILLFVEYVFLRVPLINQFETRRIAIFVREIWNMKRENMNEFFILA